MRHWLGAAAALGIIAAAMIEVEAPTAAAETATPNVLTLGNAAERGDGPVVLRGSAVGPKAAPAMTPDGQGYQIAAGRRLWFFDPVTLRIRSCINQQTSTVGVRIVRCYPGSLSNYRRTFGVTFQP
ncbi:MAG TPA: hypothetical protein VE592_07345 [Geminicoccaceae bacterium]|jgi:hypothetical protein|nr:hypothetical protein [Geminicoccaceae bacterium]